MNTFDQALISTLPRCLTLWALEDIVPPFLVRPTAVGLGARIPRGDRPEQSWINSKMTLAERSSDSTQI